MKKILIISFSPLGTDPRILRQVQALVKHYKILTIGKSPIDDERIIFYSIVQKFDKDEQNPQLKRTFFQKVIGRLAHNSKRLSKGLCVDYIISQNIETPDIIIANDWNGMALASELKKNLFGNVKIYFDAHEYAPTEYNSSLKWRVLHKPLIVWALRKCRQDISVMSTVCEGIARKYENFFDFHYGFVKVITNASNYQEFLKPKEIYNGKIRLIHHGIPQKERKMELMIQMMEYLDPKKYELTFMITKADPFYYDYLVEMSKKYENINFIAPVKFSEITKKINEYDIGVYLLCPISFNFKHSLPNKFFEFIQARLAIAIGPSVEMAKIVNDHKLGVVSKKFTPKSLAESIMKLTPEKIMEYKKNADKYAKILSAENNMIKIKQIIDELGENQQCAV